MWRRDNYYTVWVGPLISPVILKVLEKLEIEYMIHLFATGYRYKQKENSFPKSCLKICINCSTNHNSQDMELTKVSSNRWMDIENVEYI
jgi:hypothetical protein